jgi:hypothetical protein
MCSETKVRKIILSRLSGSKFPWETGYTYGISKCTLAKEPHKKQEDVNRGLLVKVPVMGFYPSTQRDNRRLFLLLILLHVMVVRPKHVAV